MARKKGIEVQAAELYNQRIRKPKTTGGDMQMNVFQRVFGSPFRALERERIRRRRAR